MTFKCMTFNFRVAALGYFLGVSGRGKRPFAHTGRGAMELAMYRMNSFDTIY
ncbi:MAG: hypothetical protein F6K39_09700 [Okeania sp. SIO3B3]|nr:hypothetical protein [Okeania sp. SIO3B3]